MPRVTQQDHGARIRHGMALICVCLGVFSFAGWRQSSPNTSQAAEPAQPEVKTFDTPRAAASALIDAANKFDEAAVIELFGEDGEDVVLSGDVDQDRANAAKFAAKAKEHWDIVEEENGKKATVVVGADDWPFPSPIVRQQNGWSFDADAGRLELLKRRVGSAELDAITVCRGYVEAQYQYAYQPREGYAVNQYAQRVFSTPGKQDGLIWRNSDGTWGGPVGEKVAAAILQQYSSRSEPYHGYFFKVLKGQGPDAPPGAISYVIEGVMIGGFALAATPAEYGVTGVDTFLVNNGGVVYQKDLGPSSLEQFKKMQVFNPDKSWKTVPDNSDNGG